MTVAVSIVISFGLKKCLKEGEDVPALVPRPRLLIQLIVVHFEFAIEQRVLQRLRLVSQVIDDGWGIAYMINENSIQFNICSKGLGSVSLPIYHVQNQATDS